MTLRILAVASYNSARLSSESIEIGPTCWVETPLLRAGEPGPLGWQNWPPASRCASRNWRKLSGSRRIVQQQITAHIFTSGDVVAADWMHSSNLQEFDPDPSIPAPPVALTAEVQNPQIGETFEFTDPEAKLLTETETGRLWRHAGSATLASLELGLTEFAELKRAQIAASQDAETSATAAPKT